MAGRPNPVVTGWMYLSAWLTTRICELADPRVQIEQAVQQAQRQHQALTQQAATVIGNQRQLQMQLDRRRTTVDDLLAQTRQSLMLADRARARADAAQAEKFERTAQTIAHQLVGAESSVEDLLTLHARAQRAAEQAREAVQTNSMFLQQRMAERSLLLSQLEQAKMQEAVAASLQQIGDVAAPGNVPTLGEVRDKIEHRYSVALGQAELAQDSGGAQVAEVRRATQALAGAARLAEIRTSMSHVSATSSD